jgi:hypothetical protein
MNPSRSERATRMPQTTLVWRSFPLEQYPYTVPVVRPSRPATSRTVRSGSGRSPCVFSVYSKDTARSLCYLHPTAPACFRASRPMPMLSRVARVCSRMSYVCRAYESEGRGFTACGFEACCCSLSQPRTAAADLSLRACQSMSRQIQAPRRFLSTSAGMAATSSDASTAPGTRCACCARSARR